VLLAMRRLYLQNIGALERRRQELAALVMPVCDPGVHPNIDPNTSQNDDRVQLTDTRQERKNLLLLFCYYCFAHVNPL